MVFGWRLNTRLKSVLLSRRSPGTRTLIVMTIESTFSKFVKDIQIFYKSIPINKQRTVSNRLKFVSIKFWEKFSAYRNGFFGNQYYFAELSYLFSSVGRGGIRWDFFKRFNLS